MARPRIGRKSCNKLPIRERHVSSVVAEWIECYVCGRRLSSDEVKHCWRPRGLPVPDWACDECFPPHRERPEVSESVEGKASGFYHPTSRLSVQEVAGALGHMRRRRRDDPLNSRFGDWRPCHEETILREIHRGNLKATKDGKTYWISRDAWADYLEANLALPKRILRPVKRRRGRPKPGNPRFSQGN